MSPYFPKAYETFGGEISVKNVLSNYTTKADLENATGIDTHKLTAKSDLVSLKAKVDKLDIDKLEVVSVDLRRLSDVVKNDVIKKIVYNGFVLKTKYDTDKSDLEKKTTDTSRLAKKLIITLKLIK